jgi:V8-like Glu-specific endopeptidase
MHNNNEDRSYPYSTVGKLFFTIGSSNYVCSASVIRPRVLLTAGHCVHSGNGQTSGWYSNWLFVPSLRDGVAPFGRWNWAYVVVTGSWYYGGGGVPNDADYAMFELRDNAGLKIGSRVGYLGWQTVSLYPNHAHLLGYPCNLDGCARMHQVAAGAYTTTYPNCAEYGSDMSGGSSGGPWVQNLGEYAAGQTGGYNSGLNQVVGVTSYGYVDGSVRRQGASIPDDRFVTVLNMICAHRAGNCP